METHASLLAQLRDIHLPEYAGMTMSVLWASTFLVLLLGAAWLWWRWQQRPRQKALRRLREAQRAYQADGDGVALARNINALLREQACRSFPAEQSAGLVEGEWLGFLDRHGGGNAFTAGAGQVLATLPYRATGVLDAAGLMSAARAWLRTNTR